MTTANPGFDSLGHCGVQMYILFRCNKCPYAHKLLTELRWHMFLDHNHPLNVDDYTKEIGK